MEGREIMPVDEEARGSGVILAGARLFAGRYRVARYFGRAMLLDTVQVPGFGPFEQYVPFPKERFDSLAYEVIGPVTRSRMQDTYAFLVNTAPEISGSGHLMLFGDEVWDSRALDFAEGVDTDRVVWRSPWRVSVPGGPVPFVLDLAGGDEGHYEDILQSMAPLVMDQKPDGVFWWVGSGANGKSSLMEALYRLFPGQLASLTVKSLTDGRDTPMLNGHLANVVKESSEGRIEDTQIYKSIGTHEDFRVHKFHSQESMTIRGNMHHIFSANQIPAFNDKGFSARRRTFIVPFNERFASDPTFEARTFTQDVLGHLVGEIMRAALEIRARQYRYKFSLITESAKLEYDAEANNAEEYAKELLDEGIVAFDNFQTVKVDYENWCSDQGFVPLGISNMRRSVQAAGFEYRSWRTQMGVVKKIYAVKTADMTALIEMGLSRRGFFTMPGFVPKPVEESRRTEAEARQALLSEEW